MADDSPEAKAWMVKAWRDLETARRAATGQPPFYDVAVYHCQQAAEKAVKAFLVHHGKPYEKTHDIEVLTDLAGEIDSTTKPCRRKERSRLTFLPADPSAVARAKVEASACLCRHGRPAQAGAPCAARTSAR
jgi:HEPN domain-containing protein